MGRIGSPGIARIRFPRAGHFETLAHVGQTTRKGCRVWIAAVVVPLTLEARVDFGETEAAGRVGGLSLVEVVEVVDPDLRVGSARAIQTVLVEVFWCVVLGLYLAHLIAYTNTRACTH